MYFNLNPPCFICSLLNVSLFIIFFFYCDQILTKKQVWKKGVIVTFNCKLGIISWDETINGFLWLNWLLHLFMRNALDYISWIRNTPSFGFTQHKCRGTEGESNESSILIKGAILLGYEDLVLGKFPWIHKDDTS